MVRTALRAYLPASLTGRAYRFELEKRRKREKEKTGINSFVCSLLRFEISIFLFFFFFFFFFLKI
jgi:hypothetical protein